MGNSKNITILFILSIIGCTIYSQSSSNFSQFFLQDYSYNSSLIGTDDNSLNVNLIHRQWGTLNYDSSPYSEFLGFETSFFKKTKLGLSGQYIRDFEGQAFTNNKFNIGVSGNQEMGNHYIGMGLSLNYSNQLFNPIEFENMESGDQALLNGQQSFNMLAPAFGLNYKFDNSKNFMFQLGASSTNTTCLLNNYSKSILKYISDEFNISLKTKFGSLSGLNGEIQALYRGNGGFDNYTGWTNTRSPRSISGIFLVNNITDIKLSMGASFNGFFLENDRLRNLSISPIVLFPINKFKIGVSYDYGLTNFQNYNNGIVELSVSYNPNIKRSRSSTTINEEGVEEDDIEEKPKKNTKTKDKSDKKKGYMDDLMLNTDISFKSLENEEIKINSQLMDDNLVATNYPDGEDYYDFANFLIGDYETGSFKIKINSNSEKDLQYDISILTKKDDEVTVLKSALLKSFSSNENQSIKLKLPYGFRKTDIYFISITCSEKSKNKISKSSSLDIKFKLNND